MAFLVALAVGGVAYVFLFPMLSGEKRAEQRVKEIADTETVVRRTRTPDAASSRRQQVVETL
jgi:tight adherence protein B